MATNGKKSQGKRTAPKKQRKLGWEAQELDDIRKNWKPGWLSREGKRRAAIRTI